MSVDKMSLRDVADVLTACAEQTDRFKEDLKGIPSFDKFDEWSNNLRNISDDMSYYIEQEFNPEI